MNRTQSVATWSWSVFLLALALVTSGCSCGAEAPADGGILPLLEAGSEHDAGHDVGVDAFAPPSCDVTGGIGGHCRAPNVCIAGSTCIDLHAGPQTANEALRLRQSDGDDPAHTGYPIARDALMAAAPFNAAEGTLCAQQCDTSVPDTCGRCTTCSAALTQMPLLAVLGGTSLLFGASEQQFGRQTGVCRIDCTFDPATSGSACPAQMTCDALEGVCVEACTTDSECNTNLGITYAGELVTVLDAAHARTCNTTTGRCEHGGNPAAVVGDGCSGDDDCAPGGGVCLSGGRCAELGCTNPNTPTSTCADAHGICLTSSESMQTSNLCLLGCNHATDCGSGNSCHILWTDPAHTVPFTIGTFTGYCAGTCLADDECIATETCTDTTSGTTVNPGRCVPRCTGVGAIGAASGGCTATEVCIADHAGATYGSCEAVDRFCGEPDLRSLPAASIDCATGWVCDELLAGVTGMHETLGDGHCTPACTGDADCTGRGSCVTSGLFAGLCRTACTSDAACTAPQVCDVAQGWCVEGPPPA